MATYICVDAGGTKCLAVMFDENFNILGRGRSGGVNTNTTTLGDCRKNVAECLGQLMSIHHPAEIDKVIAVFIGPRQVLREKLEACAHVCEYDMLGEGQAGLLAGSMRRSGLAALSGTGSDIFLVRDGQRGSTLGGWGPILGDYGSGTWIGHMALQAAVKWHEGWGEHTVLFDMVMEDWKLSRPWDVVTAVYGAEAPFRKVASVTPLVGKAARQGDKVALRIVREAGVHMAEQTEGLIRREAIPQAERHITCCGGAWKTHPEMIESFVASLDARGLNAQVVRSKFEPVMAGAAAILLDRGMDSESAARLMGERFPDYAINWQGGI